MHDLVTTMREAVYSANEAIKEIKGKGLLKRQKSPKEYVTSCDIASENMIIGVLKDHYPESSIYSEEIGEMKGDEKLLWVIDPIDGSHNLIHNLPFYAISICAFRKGEAIAGMIYIPAFNQCYFAMKGKGAFCNDKEIVVSETENLYDAMIAYDNQFYKCEDMIKNLPLIEKKCFTVRMFGSAAVDICKVSDGSFEARIFHKTKFFDFSPGLVIVKEAGGEITDFNGNKPVKDTQKVLVSNGRIHEQILRILHR